MDEGRFRNKHPYMGCRLPNCGLCSPHKRWPGAERQKQEREAMRVERSAY
jgi:hypothetical protein